MRKLVLEVFAATVLTLAAILALAPGVRASDIMVMGVFVRVYAVSAAKAGEVEVKVSAAEPRPAEASALHPPPGCASRAGRN